MHIKSIKCLGILSFLYSRCESWANSNNITGELVGNTESQSSLIRSTFSRFEVLHIYWEFGKHMFMAKSDHQLLKPQKATKIKYCLHKYLYFTSWHQQWHSGLFFACAKKKTKQKKKNLPSLLPKESLIQGLGTKEDRAITQLGVGLICALGSS